MAKEETEGPPEWAASMVKDAIEILKSDGVHIHKTYKQFLASQEPEKAEGDKPEEGDPPPAKDKPAEKPVKKSMWWGERLSE